MNTLSTNKKTQVVAALCEGNSIRSTERLMGVHRDTVMRLGRDVGEGCVRLHDRMFRDLHVNCLEVDELWSFVGKKQGRLTPEDSPEFGDSYTFLGLDANRKAIVSFIVGNRDGDTTDAFCMDLRMRVVNRPQISSDGFAPYVSAIEDAFGADVDYAQVVKEYAGSSVVVPVARRYSPPRVTRSEKIPVRGFPNPTKISTSYVERSNLSVRMSCRRFTRLTNAYSKRLRNHAAAVALFVAHYNFCRVHETLRTTPAMALGVTDHVWSVEELVNAALAMPPSAPEGAGGLEPPVAPASVPTIAAPTAPSPARPRPVFTVIRGGKV